MSYAEWDDFKKHADSPEIDFMKPYIISSISPHQFDRKCIKEGKEPPKRFIKPGEEDNTYSKIVGD